MTEIIDEKQLDLLGFHSSFQTTTRSAAVPVKRKAKKRKTISKALVWNGENSGKISLNKTSYRTNSYSRLYSNKLLSNFVIGRSNIESVAVARKVINNPGKDFPIV